MERYLFGLVCLLFPGFALSAIEVKDLKGRTMSVEVLGYTQSSGNTRIKRLPDGAIFNVKISMFDSASQDKIIAAAPKARAKLDAKLSVGRRRERVEDSSYMKRQTITGKVAIENDSRDIDFINGKATVLLVARQTKRYADDDADYGKILHKEKFDTSLKAGQSFNYECKPVVTEYDSDRDSSNIGGWEYYGWMLIIQEADGTVHSVETSIGNLKKEVDENPELGEVYLGLEVGKLVEKNLANRTP